MRYMWKRKWKIVEYFARSIIKSSLSLYSKKKCLIGFSTDSDINPSKSTNWHAIGNNSFLIEKLQILY